MDDPTAVSTDDAVVNPHSESAAASTVGTAGSESNNSSLAVNEPPKKKLCSSLFRNYRQSFVVNPVVNQEALMTKYLATINSPEFNAEASPNICTSSDYVCLRPLFSTVFSIPASSAPVERIFSHSGLIMKPHRASMSDSLLEALVYFLVSVLSW